MTEVGVGAHTYLLFICGNEIYPDWVSFYFFTITIHGERVS